MPRGQHKIILLLPHLNPTAVVLTVTSCLLETVTGVSLVDIVSPFCNNHIYSW
jgi:hypothetical protein